MECISDKSRIRCFTPQIHDRHTETYLSWFFFYFFFIYLQLAPAKTVNLHRKLYSLFTCSLIQTDESTLRGTQQKTNLIKYFNRGAELDACGIKRFLRFNNPSL